MRTIYFSPHLDDAVLSAAPIIQAEVRSGISVEIWTFMAGFPEPGELSEFARRMHAVWRLGSAEEVVAARRSEDEKAAAELGARPVYFDFLDCLYRKDKAGRPLYTDTIVDLPPEDEDLPARVAQAMRARLLPDDRIVCQLGVGRHIDHIIVRKAAEMLGRPLLYDADMPYVLDHPDELAPLISGMQPEFQPVSEQSYHDWLAAIRCYSSQIDAVFGGEEQMREHMGRFWRAERGIRLWSRSGDGRRARQTRTSVL